MGGSVFGPHRRERIVFLGKIGDARLGRLKKGLGHSKIARCREKYAKPREAKTCLDRTGASRASARNHIEPEGQAYVKD